MEGVDGNGVQVNNRVRPYQLRDLDFPSNDGFDGRTESETPYRPIGRFFLLPS